MGKFGLREPLTGKERRAIEQAAAQGIPVRAKRGKVMLPHAWDDKTVSRAGKHGWKQQKGRRHQWESREELIQTIIEALMESDHMFQGKDLRTPEGRKHALASSEGRAAWKTYRKGRQSKPAPGEVRREFERDRRAEREKEEQSMLRRRPKR